MSYVSFNDVIELNGILKDKGLNFRIHLRDTCGRQSFWIEPLGNCACEGRYDEMYQVVEEYLEGKGFSVQYDEQKMNYRSNMDTGEIKEMHFIHNSGIRLW